MKQHRTKGDGNNKCTHGIARGQEAGGGTAGSNQGRQYRGSKTKHNTHETKTRKWRLDKTQGRQDDARK